MENERQYYSEYTLDELAKIFGVTKERIRQIEQSALRKIKNPKVSKKLRGYLES